MGSCGPHLPPTHPSCARAPGEAAAATQARSGRKGRGASSQRSQLLLWGCVRWAEARANSFGVELSTVAPIDLAHCSVTAHHMKHAPINLAWNYQLSRQLIWRGSKALRRAASHNELLLCHSTPHEQICKQLYALNIIHENYHKMDIHI